MKVHELLKISVFQGTVVVAGQQGMDREVNTVNMIDAPDIIHFLKRNELIVTTAFHFKDDLAALLQLIREMERQGCCGLGIKTKRFLNEIPEEAMALANELQLPILELPVHTSLGDIVNKTLSHILDIRTHELQQAMQTHQQFSNHIINGQGIQKIISDIATLIQLPVMLLNQHLRPTMKQTTYTALIEQLERLITGGYLSRFSKTTMTSFSFLHSNQEAITLFPIYTHKQCSYLCVLGHISPSDHATILAIKQATNVIAFELMKEHALKQHERRIRNEFFRNLINGTFSTSEEIMSRAREFGLLHEQRYVCAVGKLDKQEQHSSFFQHQLEQELIHEGIELETQLLQQTVHVFIVDDSYILLTHMRDGWKALEKSFICLLEGIQTKIAAHFQEELSFGISIYAQLLTQIPISYKEATDTIYYETMAGKRQFIALYQPKEVPEILRMIPYEQLHKFYTDTFQAFSNKAKKDRDLLLHTLSVYLETHCELAETAKRLYVHRNTVIYRLEKCEEIMGRSLKDADETLRLRLAFRIKALLPS